MGGLLWFNMSEEASLLVSAETYEENAVNIGTQQKSADMSRFIDRSVKTAFTSSTSPPRTPEFAPSLPF